MSRLHDLPAALTRRPKYSKYYSTSSSSTTADGVDKNINGRISHASSSWHNADYDDLIHIKRPSRNSSSSSIDDEKKKTTSPIISHHRRRVSFADECDEQHEQQQQHPNNTPEECECPCFITQDNSNQYTKALKRSSSSSKEYEHLRAAISIAPQTASTCLPHLDLGSIATTTMNTLTSSSSYYPHYNNNNEMIPPEYTTEQDLDSLQKHEFAFVKRSKDIWTYAIIADRDTQAIRFVVDTFGSTKVLKRKHWNTNCIRLVNTAYCCRSSNHQFGDDSPYSWSDDTVAKHSPSSVGYNKKKKKKSGLISSCAPTLPFAKNGDECGKVKNKYNNRSHRHQQEELEGRLLQRAFTIPPLPRRNSNQSNGSLDVLSLFD